MWSPRSLVLGGAGTQIKFRLLDIFGGNQMGGGKMGGRGRFWRSGPVSEVPAMGIGTQSPLPEGPAFGGALGEDFWGPYAPQGRLWLWSRIFHRIWLTQKHVSGRMAAIIERREEKAGHFGSFRQ